MKHLMIAAALAAQAPLLAASADDTLDQVIERASRYVVEFRQQLSGIVAEEHYSQDLRPAMGVSLTGGSGGSAAVPHRELVSDIAMVRTGDGYVEFRDVFQVDSRPVRDREDRLMKLFLAPESSGRAQILRINEESARYNIGNVYRNFNTPAVALMFLEPELIGRFRFRRADSRPPSLVSGWNRGQAERWRFPADTWTVEYQETAKGTLIRRQTGGGDMPARGRFWIDPASGAVLLSELQVGDPLARVTIAVAFAADPVASVRVPIEMRERYLNGTTRVTTEGTAQYGRLRRFTVGTDEVIPPVTPPAAAAP